MPDAEKRGRAHVVIDTGRGYRRGAGAGGRLHSGACGATRLTLTSDASRKHKDPGMREIVLDTETTGLDPNDGHRLVEIGCVEMANGLPDRPDLAPLLQSRARHAAGGLRRPRPVARLPCRQAALRRAGRGVPGLHRRCAPRHPQCRLRHALPQCRARPARTSRSCRSTASSTRWRWRGAAIPAPGSRSTSSASATASTIRSGSSTAPCSTRRSWPRSISSLPAAGRRRSASPPKRSRSPCRSDARLLRQRPVPLAPRLTPEERAAHAAFVAGLGEAALWHRYPA